MTGYGRVGRAPVAIVTGASSGIGFGCATKLAEMGMAVVGTGRDEDRLAELEKAIGDADRVATMAVDLTADDAPKRIVDLALQRWGRVDFLINNAGVGSPKPLHETDDESLDHFLGLMLRAPFRLAREVIPHMQPGSAIINVTSTFAIVGGLRGGAYSAAKGGLTALTLHIACQYGPAGNPLQRSSSGRDAHADGRCAARRREIQEDQHRDDAAPAAGQGRRHRQHRRLPVLGGCRLHQRPDDRRRRWLEFDEVPVGLRAELGMGRPLNLFALLDQAAARFGDRGAVYHGERQLCTWGELRDRALRMAGSLRELGPGSRVAVASENRPEIIELMFAVWAAECVYLPINYKLHAREMQQIIDDAGAAMIFASPTIAADLSSVTDVPIEVIGSGVYQTRLGSDSAPPPDNDPAELAWLFYTSGTTGRSKGAMLSHRNLMAMTLAHLADFDSPDEDCSLVHGAPMSHGSGLYIPPYVLRAARQVIPESGAFEPGEFLDLCEHHPGCSAFLAPTMVQRLVQTGRPRPRNLRTVVYGGGPMYVDSLKKAMAAFGPIFTQLYGQGEAPMTITGLRRADHLDADDAVLGSVGYARSGVDVAVLRDDGSPAAIDEIGEIVCRGDVVMSGYWKNPKATAVTLQNGWLHTGDLGSFDERGFLTLRDRSKDVVISGGSNIYPREVEEALLEHPGVVEAGVVGAKDEEWGEVVVAFVVGEVEAAELDAHLLDRMARFKRPKRYEFVDELPKNSYGKVLKRELRQRLS